jgi:hypothetical protein
MYLETEVMTSSNFFPQKLTYILAYFKELIFLNNFCKEKNLLSCLNRDDCEFLISNTYVLFFYKFAYNFLTEKDRKFFSLQNLFRKISSLNIYAKI